MAALGAHRERASQRIETEHRIRARHEGDRGDRVLRNQIPVHGVAERLIHPDAVHVDRQALRRAEERRCREAVIVDIELERIVRTLAHVDAAEVVVEIVGYPERLLTLHVFAVGGLHVCRDLIERQSQPFERRVRNDSDLRKLRRCCRITRQLSGRVSRPCDRGRGRGHEVNQHRQSKDRFRACQRFFPLCERRGAHGDCTSRDRLFSIWTALAVAPCIGMQCREAPSKSSRENPDYIGFFSLRGN